MKIDKLQENVRPHAEGLVRLKEMGNIYEVRSMSRTPTMPIKKLNKDYFVELGTGEVKEFKHTEHRTDNLTSVAQSVKHMREYINTNVIDPRKALFITLTYAENMQDPKRLYNDFRKFNMRLAYYIRKNHLPIYEYLVAIEPQARGSLHAHLLLIFQKKAPFIPSVDLAKIWGHGFIKIRALKNIDNIGAYLSAYLGDMELGEALGVGTSGNSFKVVETTDESGKRQSKAIVKGARLRLYPKGFRLFRKSRGIVLPVIKDFTEAEAMREIGNAALTYEKTIKIVDDSGKTCSIINYRHYNKKRKSKPPEG
ncbi:hypothetical protein [Oscillibacter sp.]|uniref:rolling circle replication-associated protein n=1 Tax=Oscillibacter sp. TaxID=1945593 RepID=UPI002897AFDD|nr:hypothetical protein [Oscillibacter sp.]